MRVERLDDNFAKTGNIALSNGPKMSQLPVIDDVHVPGIRAWPAGHLAGLERPERGRVRGKRGREGWGGRRALVHGYVVNEKRELTMTLGEEREGKWVAKGANVAESKLLKVEMSSRHLRLSTRGILQNREYSTPERDTRP